MMQRMMQLVLGNFPCGAWVYGKIDPQQSDRCSMCRRALRMERGSNFSQEEVPRETIQHISSAGCKGQEEVVTGAHKTSFRDLTFDATRHQRATSDRELTTLGSDKTLDSLWQIEEFASICSREELWESVADEEAEAPLETGTQGEEHKAAELWRRFWDKRPDGMVIDKKDKVCYILEFKRVMERYGGGQEKTKRKAELQHNRRVRGLEKALKGGEWQVILIVFVGGMCGSVEEKACMANMELLGVVEGERDAIRKRHVWRLLEEQDRVLRSYYAQWEGLGGQRKSGRERVGRGVYL